MSGHSKWAQIKRQKGAADVKRGAAFTKLANAISIAAREGGKDPAHNVRLRLAVDKARAANMPKDNIERAIKRGAGDLEGRQLEAVTYEGFGPAGVAVVAEAVTDNRNRTTAELRSVLAEHGGNLGTTNSVLWMFSRRGVLELPVTDQREQLELAAIDAGADDLETEGDTTYVYADPTHLTRIRETLEDRGFTVRSASLALVPNTTTAPPAEQRDRVQSLLLALEDLDDVTSVATNAEF